MTETTSTKAKTTSTKAKTTSTVTFRGCADEPGIRSVRVGEQRFLLDTPVSDVNKSTVDTLLELDGHRFDVK